MDWDLVGFGVTLHVLVQMVILSSWAWTSFAAFLAFLWDDQMAVSSAKSLVFVRGLSETGKSAQYVM